MDQAKSGLIRTLFIKGRGAEIFSQFARPLSCESHLKIPRNLAQLLAIRILILSAAQSSTGGLFLLHPGVGKGAMNKF